MNIFFINLYFRAFKLEIIYFFYCYLLYNLSILYSYRIFLHFQKILVNSLLLVHEYRIYGFGFYFNSSLFFSLQFVRVSLIFRFFHGFHLKLNYHFLIFVYFANYFFLLFLNLSKGFSCFFRFAIYHLETDLKLFYFM